MPGRPSRHSVALTLALVLLAVLWIALIRALREEVALGRLQTYAPLLQTRCAQGRGPLTERAPDVGASRAFQAVKAWQLARCRVRRPFSNCIQRVQFMPAQIPGKVLRRLGKLRSAR